MLEYINSISRRKISVLDGTILQLSFTSIPTSNEWIDDDSGFALVKYPLGASFTSSELGGYAYQSANQRAIEVLLPSDLHLEQDFTLEMWINGPFINRHTTNHVLSFAQFANTVNEFSLQIYQSKILTYIRGSRYDSPLVTLHNNKWTHIAWTRASGNVRVFLDGVNIHTYFNDSIMRLGTGSVFTIPYVGGNGGSGSYNGKYHNFRLIKGEALYVNNFVPKEKY